MRRLGFSLDSRQVPSSVKTISEAARAASVAPQTAIPTSATFNAGASLTPSPRTKRELQSISGSVTIIAMSRIG